MPDIVVPIKQVPDMERVKFDTEAGRIDRSSAPGEINPFDLHALEAAIRIKEKLGGTVTTISMGPPQAESTVRDSLARGADCGILLAGREFAGADTWATSYTLACAIRKVGKYDLIICGEKTVDGDTGQVGPEIADWLDIPHVAYVSEIRDTGEKSITVVAEMEDDRLVIEAPFPVLLTVTKDLNMPRLPSFQDKMRARKAEIAKWGAADIADVANPANLGLKGSPTRLNKVVIPSEEGRKGKVFRGSSAEAAASVAEALAGLGVLGGAK
ncbi:MAG TPA: electron transfer flavoprotein beta subunit/FixA family protein [Dehalococcoidia bacterium]|nr:electron transfer flavoprotein beta subunit/FixA family protein [Dehalococcoidia bacterium]